MPDKLKKGWKTWRFDQIATMVNERVDNPEDAGVDHYVGLEHLDPESLTIRRWGSPSDVAATKLRFRKGDIIFGRRRVYQRKLAVAHFDGICSAHAMVLRAKPDIALPDFLPFFMQSDLFMERAKKISVGSLSPTINWKTLAQEEFALPPLDEQRRIAKGLGRARAFDDSLDALEEKCINVLSAAAAEQFDKVRTSGALFVPFSEICVRSPESGIYKSESFRGQGVPIVNMGELFGNDIVDEHVEMQRVMLSEKERQRYALTPNDLLFGRRSVVLEGAGKCVLVGDLNETVVFESSVLRATLNPDVADSRYVFEWFRSPYGHQQLKRIVTFTTVSGIAGSDLAKSQVPLPSLHLQKQIAESLSNIRLKMLWPGRHLSKFQLLYSIIIHEVFGR